MQEIDTAVVQIIAVNNAHWLIVGFKLVTRGNVLCPSLVLVQPRKTRPCLNERLLMGHKESNQTNVPK